MLLNQLFLAASAAAFLVVPEVPAEDEEAFKALPIDAETYEILPIATAQTIDVPCKSCRGRNTHIELEFTIEDGTALAVNGYELYPEADPFQAELIASEVRGNGKTKDQVLGYGLGVSAGPIDDEQGMEIVNVELRVIQVGDRFVDDVPVVSIQLVKAGSELLIGSVESTEPHDPECETLWCRIQKGFRKTGDTLRKGLGCGTHGRPHDPTRGPHGNGMHHHHKNKHAHKWGKLLKNVAANVLLPVMMGLIAGVSVAVFTMGVCSCLAILIKTRRSKRRCLVKRSKAPITEPAYEDEKSGLMDNQDAPPEYEQTPKEQV